MIHHKITQATREIGRPADWDDALDGPCGSVHVRDEIDALSGCNVMWTLWKPTAEELDVLRGGGMLKLGIMGRIHPVIRMEIVP